MKINRKYLKFLIVFFLTAFVFIFILFFSLIKSPTLRTIIYEIFDLSQLQNQEQEYVTEGRINVTFDDEISYKEALTLIKAVGVKAREKNRGDVRVFGGTVYAVSEVPITNDLLQSLQDHEIIDKAITNWTVGNGIILDIAEDTSRSEVKSVVSSYELIFYDYNRRTILEIYVPVGLEQKYVNIFLMYKEDGVKDAYRPKGFKAF